MSLHTECVIHQFKNNVLSHDNNRGEKKEMQVAPKTANRSLVSSLINISSHKDNVWQL